MSLDYNLAFLEFLKQHITETFPELTALLLWTPIKVVDEDFLIKTNGKSIRLGNKFFQMNQAYKTLASAINPSLSAPALLPQVKELTKIALAIVNQHPQEAMLNGRDRTLWNMASMVFFNQILGITTSDSLANLLPKELNSILADITNWDVQSLYEILKKLIKFVPADAYDSTFDETFDDPLPGYIKDIYSQDYLTQQQHFRQVLQQLKAGSNPGSLFAKFKLGNFEIKIAYFVILRKYMLDATSAKFDDDWSRPHKRNFACGNDEFLMPNIAEVEGIDRIFFLIDTSGSVLGDPTALPEISSHVDYIQNLTGCDIHFIAWDAVVQVDKVFKADGISFKSKVESNMVDFKGGGGTCIGPAMKLVESYKPKLVLVFTDLGILYDGCKDSYPFPILFISTDNKLAAPFGRTLYMRPE